MRSYVPVFLTTLALAVRASLADPAKVVCTNSKQAKRSPKFEASSTTFRILTPSQYQGMPGYPSDSEWDSLRQTTDNRLGKCPDAVGCTSGSTVPDYVLDAESAEDISAVMRFATEHNLRVSIRNTGHDFLSRNCGQGGIKILTRNMNGASWTDSWTPGVGHGGHPDSQVGESLSAVIIGAGMEWSGVMKAVQKHGHSVVHGADPTVGASGGWIMGGGHGPYSNQYGLGTDNVLEFEAVLPNGDIVVANENSYSDLFWALRGGGGGTFAAVTRTVVKTFPTPSMNGVTVSIRGSGPSFLDAMAYYYAMAPNLTDFGLSGNPVHTDSSYVGLLNAPGKSTSEITAFMDPIVAHMRDLGATVSALPFPDFSDASLPDDQTPDATMLLRSFHEGKEAGNEALETHNRVRRQIMTDTETTERMSSRLWLGLGGTTILSYPAGGGAVAENRNLSVSLNPAWRDASMHFMVLGRGTQETALKAMEPLSANSGAYINEAYPKEEDWKLTFYGGGANYEKLEEIKNKYDPTNTLWCKMCVGSDVFVEDDDGLLMTV